MVETIQEFGYGLASAFSSSIGVRMAWCRLFELNLSSPLPIICPQWIRLGTIEKESLMTVQLDWPPDVVDRLTEEARKKGLSLDAYLLQTVLQQEGSNGAPTDDTEKRRKRAAAGARILEIQKRVKADPEGWTSRDYINYGRR
jgi:hypothetical protein